jgi:hypothetical protein
MAAVRETKNDDNQMDLRSDDDRKTPTPSNAALSNGNNTSSNGNSNGNATSKIPDGWPNVLNTNGYPHSLKISKGKSPLAPQLENEW